MAVTVTKGLIGLEDLSRGTGTFTRTTSTGGTATMTKVPLPLLNNVVSVVEYGAVGDGSTDDRSAIQDALDAVYDAGGGTVVIPRGTGDYSLMGIWKSAATQRCGSWAARSNSMRHRARLLISGTLALRGELPVVKAITLRSSTRLSTAMMLRRTTGSRFLETR